MHSNAATTAAIITLAAITLAACAKKPESIAPAYVSGLNYKGLTCPQLREEYTRLSAAYTTAAEQQNNARTNDVVGVLFIGLPVSSLSGDNIAPEIARLKGEKNAVQQAMLTTCTG